MIILYILIFTYTYKDKKQVIFDSMIGKYVKINNYFFNGLIYIRN